MGQPSRRNSPGKTGKTGRAIFSSSEIILVKKDLGAVWGRKGVRALLMLVPLLLAVVIPMVYFAAISLTPIPSGAQVPKGIWALLPEFKGKLEYRQAWIEAFTTLLCPMLLLCVPLLTGAVSSACAFMGEKEEGTLETLLLSSMDAKSIFNAKVTGCTLLSTFLSVVAFAAFFLTAAVGDLLTGAPFFLRIDWLVLVFLVTPAMSVFSVVFVSLIITRVHSTGEAMQTLGYLVLPVVLVYLVQFTGVFRLHWAVLLAVAAGLAVLSVILYNLSAQSFQPEKLFARPPEDLADGQPR
ncbi:hypothetical protein D5272_00380 [bacterium D16-76]|nr:hypothetical protein [bacterium D16-76]